MVSEASGPCIHQGRVGSDRRSLWTASSRSTCAETNRAPTLVEQTREIARRANISDRRRRIDGAHTMENDGSSLHLVAAAGRVTRASARWCRVPYLWAHNITQPNPFMRIDAPTNTSRTSPWHAESRRKRTRRAPQASRRSEQQASSDHQASSSAASVPDRISIFLEVRPKSESLPRRLGVQDGMQSITTHFYSKNTTRDSQHTAPHLSTAIAHCGRGLRRARSSHCLCCPCTRSHCLKLLNLIMSSCTLRPARASSAGPTEVGTYHCAL